MKKEWVKPVVEEVALDFDKEMDSSCYSSSGHTTPGNAICGEAVASKCWSSQATVTPPPT